jgi:hypothetical protein
MKIAICLFGDLTDYRKVKEFFSSDKHKFFYFAHSYSSFTDSDFTNISIDDPYILQDTSYFTDLGVDNIARCTLESQAIYNRPGQCTDITNSMMQANILKTKYEFENDMIFDVVVNSRFNLNHNSIRFDNIIKNNMHNYPTCIFGNYRVNYTNYRTSEFNCDFCFGSSLTMDIANNFHRYYNNGAIYKILNSNYYDPAYKTMHYKTLFWKWINMKNITPMFIENFIE